MTAKQTTLPRIALVGVTGYGNVHFSNLRALTEAGEANLAAAAVINPDHPAAAEPLAWLRAHGATVYPNAEALFAAESGRLDFVCLPVGIAAHEPLVAVALKAGANVLVEKPAAGCTAAVDRMIALEHAAAPLRVAVGFQHMWAPETKTILDTLSSGSLGAVQRVSVAGIWPRDDAYYARNGWAGRLATPDGTPVRDSPANNAFAHYLNLALVYAGATGRPAVGPYQRIAQPVAVEGALWRARPEIETFDSCMVRFATDCGVPVLICLSHTADETSQPRIRVDCEHGTVRWTHEGPWNITPVGEQGGRAPLSGLAVCDKSVMFRSLLRGEPPHSTLATARAQVRAVELLTEKLPVTPLRRSAVRGDNGQWLVPGLPEVFDRAFSAGDLLLPEWD